MSEFNPYQTPAADVEPRPPTEAQLAGRGQRFAAAMIDGLISIALMTPILMAMGYFDYAQHGRRPPFALVVVSLLISFGIFAAVHFIPINNNGQTVGKKLIKIRIADLAQDKPHAAIILGRRYLPIYLAQLIPVLGPLLSTIDVLFIFRSDRRCVHDLIASTQVVRCE